MNSPPRIASLSLDLDNHWSYLKVHGDSGWEGFSSYLDLLIPRVLDFLVERKLRITFFVVGQDAALEKNHSSLRMITAAGHEVGNHSFSHEPWFHRYDRERVTAEISRAEESIAAVTGQRPVGFRGPGFTFSEIALQVLEERGYLYDASTFPTFIGPLARIYYFCHAELDRENRQERSLLFGSLTEGFRPLAPYRWRSGEGILEIPVTTMPVTRLPIHLSYLLFISRFSHALAVSYFRGALKLCSLAGISPSLLLHPLDFLGSDDKVGLEFFPAMQLSRSQKLSFLDEIFAVFCGEFSVVPLFHHAEAAIEKFPDALADSRPRRNHRWANDI